jgi:hypothetical protein
LAPEDGVIRRLVVAVVMLAAAVVLALLARDTWHWSRAVADADARAAVASVPANAWRADTTLPLSLTRRLLGIGDDLAFRRTEVRAIAMTTQTPTTKSQKQRSFVETALARIARGDSDPVRAARAADYLGVLLYQDPPSPEQAANAYQDPAQAGPSDQQTPEQKAAVQFTTAVRLDPTDDNAARNLELMLRLPQPPPHQGSPQAGGGERFGHKGSGARPPGYGY